LEDPYREEVLNVLLAIVLGERGILSVPETITKRNLERRLPDVVVADFWGVRTVIEGRISDAAGVVRTLEQDAKRRVEEGLAQVCIAVIYPQTLRREPFDKLKDSLAAATFRIRVFTQAGDGEWNDGDTNALAAMLRRAYEGMIKEDVLEAAVQELRSSIEDSAQDLLESKATPEVLRKILGLPEGPVEDDEEEED
jgi:hypothetical protein